MLSGCSAVNYGMWTRGSRIDYDLWAKAVGDQRWSYDSMLPFFKKTETHHKPDVDVALHGISGPIRTTVTTNRAYPLKHALIESYAKASGLPQIEDANAGDPIGLAPYTETWREGKRQPAGHAYGLDGVKVMTSTLVKRIVIDASGTATGAELVDGRIIHANKEVIVSCGTLKSPQVLILSGIGPKAELAKHGITPAASGEMFSKAAESVGEEFVRSPRYSLVLPSQISRESSGGGLARLE